MLQRVEIEGFKSIKTLELKLRPVNILIGPNGVGKSNFISFFKLVNNIYEQRLENYSLKTGVDNLLHYGKKNTNRIRGYLGFGSNAYSFQLSPTANNTLFIDLEESIYYPAINNKAFYEANLKESTIKDSTTKRNDYLREHLKSFKIYHFHDTSSSAPLRSKAELNDNRSLKEDGRNLPAYLYYLREKHPLNFKRIEKIIQSVVPFFDRFDLAPLVLEEDKILLEWQELEHPETYFNATHLSDGSLRFMALVTLLMQPRLPKVIIIDEPELGLHPTAINKLAALIKSAAAKNCQVIVSTQSVTLLNNFDADDVITVDKENNQSVFRRLDKELLSHWIEDYSIGELWTKSVIKGQTL